MIESKRLPALPLILLGAIATFTGHAAENAAAARIGEAIDESDRARFPGNTHPSAISRNDEGPVEPDYPMAGVRLLLRRSPQQESALKLLMAQQADPKSANFHHWLSPDEFGTRFGPSDADLATLSRWLGSQGLTVTDVNKGRTFMQFSGTASAVGQAFRMEMHHYLVKGQAHIANNGDPSIPAALTPVVGGIASLSDFHAKPLHHDLGTVKRNPATGRWVSPTVAASRQTGTQFTLDGMYGYELVAPLDFATIYNILPLWNAGIDGTGQTIAIAGRSDISLSDVATFRAAFGLPVNVPRVIVNGADPGVPTWGDKVENTLDVEWSGAVAKGAQIIFVTSASTFMDGAQESAQYIIENRTAPIMSFSYGLCELEMGSAGNAAYNALWQQAAAEGIAVFVAAGDTSSAGCDFGGYPSYGAQQGVAVSGTASTPYNTAVGGTDFNALNLQSTSYWSNGGPQYGATALQYIPEVPWNDTCTSLAYLTSLGVLAGGQDAEQYCNAMLEQGKYLASLTTIGGAGGVSACTTPGTGAASSCTGGYLKPSWPSRHA
jgi:subtilase family serine protease